jgi:hypothetical protein
MNIVNVIYKNTMIGVLRGLDVEAAELKIRTRDGEEFIIQIGEDKGLTRVNPLLLAFDEDYKPEPFFTVDK